MTATDVYIDPAGEVRELPPPYTLFEASNNVHVRWPCALCSGHTEKQEVMWQFVDDAGKRRDVCDGCADARLDRRVVRPVLSLDGVNFGDVEFLAAFFEHLRRGDNDEHPEHPEALDVIGGEAALVARLQRCRVPRLDVQPSNVQYCAGCVAELLVGYRRNDARS